MEATIPGNNRTGAAQAAAGVKKMLDAVKAFSPPKPVSTLGIDVERQQYITAANTIGSIPPVQTASSGRKSKAPAEAPALSGFLDKLGERIAFERTGTRLYDALISKYLALSNTEQSEDGADSTSMGLAGAREGESALETLQRIRADELGHFKLLCDCVQSLGGDPTAQTPSADVTAAASMGLMQVITDPRTTFAQSLNAILTAELTDNVAWEMLSELAVQAGQPELAEKFAAALESEAEHLSIVRTWLESCS